MKGQTTTAEFYNQSLSLPFHNWRLKRVIQICTIYFDDENFVVKVNLKKEVKRIKTQNSY